MSKVDERFATLGQSGQRAFMPFVTAGDPHLGFTEKLLVALDEAGSDLIELGIPYSDPIADGPVIQESYTRALHGGVKLKAIFEMLQRVTPRLKSPVVMMISYAIIFRWGMETFLQQATQAGVAGAIVPDLPADESEALAAKCREYNFSLIQLITPTTPFERAVEIANRSSGFVYCVSVTGITGERRELSPVLIESITQLKRHTKLPICVGFGISQPAHIEHLKPVADGFIVGSAIVKRIAEVAHGTAEEVVLSEVKEFARSMIAAGRD